MDEITIALAGNPNSGKTTVFNAITGARQHVGNYPGVTVEKKEGRARVGDTELHVVDLPGTYSLTAYSIEELVARNFVIQDRPDVVVDIIDASNLERNLYLATQFIELGAPTVLALNMMDVAEARGKRIDVALLSELLGVPIVPTVASRDEGIDRLLEVAIETARERRVPAKPVTYGRELEDHVQQLAEMLDEEGGVDGLSSRWIAIKLLENDSAVHKFVQATLGGAEALLDAVRRARSHLEEVVGEDAEIALADQRYGFIAGACAEATEQTQETRRDWSEAIDSVVTSRLLGIPIFLALMWALFEMVFTLGAPLMGWVESFFGWLGDGAVSLIPEGEVQSLIVDGIIGGVGGVLVFIPPIFLLFLAIAILEDSGYMARGAFVVDRLMHKIGLHGKSFIPMLIGFGCTVPAVMATRTLESRRDRLLTILVTPLMSCGAKLPVYVLLAGAFFPADIAGKVIFSVYVLGVVLAILMAKLFGALLLPGEAAPFVMELPPYRMPTAKGLLIHMWERGWLYLKKAGTIILGISIVMWFLLSHPARPEPPPGASAEPSSGIEHTYAGQMGRAIEPVLRPLGFDWKIGIGLVAGFAAKEVVVATFGTVYALEEADEESEDLRAALRQDPQFNPLVAYALMVFVLIYVPCMAAVAVIKRETNSWKWPLFVIGYTTALAWLVSFIVYQGGMALGLG
jgi:ferrous iron transport protein B